MIQMRLQRRFERLMLFLWAILSMGHLMNMLPPKKWFGSVSSLMKPTLSIFLQHVVCFIHDLLGSSQQVGPIFFFPMFLIISLSRFWIRIWTTNKSMLIQRSFCEQTSSKVIHQPMSMHAIMLSLHHSYLVFFVLPILWEGGLFCDAARSLWRNQLRCLLFTFVISCVEHQFFNV